MMFADDKSALAFECGIKHAQNMQFMGDALPMNIILRIA